MKRYVWLACAVFVAALPAGCVERRYIIHTEVAGVPGDAGAKLYVNGKTEDITPYDDYFVYYGHYHFTLQKDGYQTLQVDQNIPAPWYEWLLIDFFAENVWPFKIRDVREFTYVLQSTQTWRPEDVLNRGNMLRDRGQTVQPLPDAAPPPPKPAPPPTPVTAPPAPPVPPGH
jgi:hypothetical protein